MQNAIVTDEADDQTRQLRANVHRMWGSVAAAWGANAAYVDERSAPMTVKMLDLAELQDGARVLELACGPGGLGMAAAVRVGANGQVVLSDAAPEMVSVARERSQRAGLANVSVLPLDLEEIDQPDGAFDVVLCREGLMFAFDPVAASREIARVLRPGGRAVVAVWGPREANPWLAILFGAVSEQLGAPVPPPGIPGPLALGDRARLHGLLEQAGLEDVAVEDFPVPLLTRSFDEWWDRTTALAGPLAAMLAALPDEAVEAIRDRARAATDAYATSQGLELPGLSLVASGRRPGG